MLSWRQLCLVISRDGDKETVSKLCFAIAQYREVDFILRTLELLLKDCSFLEELSLVFCCRIWRRSRFVRRSSWILRIVDFLMLGIAGCVC
jgi:hypothetical protein